MPALTADDVVHDVHVLLAILLDASELSDVAHDVRARTNVPSSAPNLPTSLP
jgi:hypothetical protein